MQKKIQNLELVQGAISQFFGSLKNNGTIYLLFFYGCCEDIWNSKAFTDNATSRSYRELITIFIKHN